MKTFVLRKSLETDLKMGVKSLTDPQKISECNLHNDLYDYIHITNLVGFLH